MTTAIAKPEQTPRAELAPVSPSRGAYIMADALKQESEQRQLLGSYVAHHMSEGTDYGVIPGTKNKTLLKPGAEKLTQLFRCIPRFTIEDKVENWETGLFHYRFRCSIVTQADDTVVAEGVGSCSTYEDKYRWRSSERTCPACGKAAIIKGKAEYGGGWLCFGKKGGCGAKFGNGDQSIEGQSTARIQNPDIINCVNTVLKIAKKRALVDAAIALARCSDIFTQDLDDYAEPESPKVEPPRMEQPKPNSLPATGLELHARLQKYDAALAQQKLCVRGDLLAYVCDAGGKAGYGANMAEWSGPAIPFAVEVVKEFEKVIRSKPPIATPATSATPKSDEPDLTRLRSDVEVEVLESGGNVPDAIREHARALGIDVAKHLPTLDELSGEQLQLLYDIVSGGPVPQPAGAP